MKKQFAIGILTIALVGMVFNTMPSVTKGFDGQIKIGVIGPQGLPHWSPGMKEAAEMARDEINAAGGISLPSGDYEIVLALANEHAYPTPDPPAAAMEMQRLCDPAEEACDFIIGGHSIECTTAMIEVAADFQVPFFIDGAYSHELMNDTVGTDYARYKYLFKAMPTNITTQLRSLAGFCNYVIPQLLEHYGEYLWPEAPNPQIRVAILSEDREWTIPMHYVLTHPAYYPSILGPFANVTYAGRIPDGTTDCTPWLVDVISSQAILTIHIFSGITGVPLVAQWKALQVDSCLVGINQLAQLDTHWTTTVGACEFETIVGIAGTRTPIIPDVTDVFWDNFVAKTGHWPMSTAWGAYDCIYMLAEALETIGSKDRDALVAHFEDPSYERTCLRGLFKFTLWHDIYSNEFGPWWTQGYVRPFVVQWQTGRLEVVWPIDQTYTKDFLFNGRVAITNIELYKNVVGQGQTLKINVTVTNQGLLPLKFPDFTGFTCYYGDSPIETLPVTNLYPGESTTLTYDWNTTGVAKGNYTINAAEIDEPNNNYIDDWVIVAIVGDITGPDGYPDGKCDIRDLALVAIYFGQDVPPAPPNCDVTGPTKGLPDGKIDIRDLATVAIHYGEIDP